MEKRLETIKQIDQAIAEITMSLNKIVTIKNKETDEVIARALNEYILALAYLNLQFMTYLMSITHKSVKKDYIDEEFKKMMKGLFKNGE